tara:strand:+ start:147 stop:371 length:225 start_codon:yes stop_codon:yes gene_type:complete
MILILVSFGVILSLFGLLGLSAVIYLSLLVRKNSNHYSEEEKKNTLERLIIINYLALSLAAFGLIVILVGLLLR